MSYKIIIDPLAMIDINESIEWYNNTQEKLGNRFYNKVHKTIEFIKKNPYSFAIRYKNSRIAPIEKFPFMVHYTIDEKKKIIPVLAVLHTSRNPKIWDIRSK